MRSSLAVIAALCIGSAVVGCSKHQPARPSPIPPVIKPPVVAQSWTFKLESKCGETIEDSQCIGKYGFSVRLPDGQYQLGPGQNGETRTGVITDTEMNELKKAAGSLLTVAQAQIEEGHAAMEAVEKEDTVSFIPSATGTATIVAKTSGTEFTYKMKSADDAKLLLTTMNELAKTYYKLPFPDACMDGLSSVQALLDSVQTCTTNADCAFIDANFDAMDPALGNYLATDDCKIISPLGAGNANLVKNSKEKLMEALSQIELACGEKFSRGSECTVAGFNLTPGATPSCIQGVCKAVPTSIR